MVVMTVPFWYDVASLSVECTAVVCHFVCIGCIIIGKIPLSGEDLVGKMENYSIKESGMFAIYGFIYYICCCRRR